MSDFDAPIDPEILRRERAKARELRQSQWWKRRIADGVCYYCRRRVGHRALTMDPELKRSWAEGLREIIFSRNPGDWVDDQLRDIEAARSAA